MKETKNVFIIFVIMIAFSLFNFALNQKTQVEIKKNNEQIQEINNNLEELIDKLDSYEVDKEWQDNVDFYIDWLFSDIEFMKSELGFYSDGGI